MISHRNIVTEADILKERLFGNNMIKHNNKPLYFKHWSKSSIQTIGDIWAQTKWLSSEIILNKLTITTKWMHEYKTILESIPREWKRTLKQQPNNLHSKFKWSVNTDEQIYVNGRVIIKNEKLDNKKIKAVLLQNNPAPKAEIKWENKLNQNLNWESIWYNIKSLRTNRKAKQLQWKFIHRVIFTEKKLAQMKQSNGLCKICQSEEEDIIHLFCQCEHTKVIWENIGEKINDKYNITLTQENKLFGINDNKEPQRSITNSIIFITKWYIWKARCNLRYSDINPEAETILNQINKNIEQNTPLI